MKTRTELLAAARRQRDDIEQYFTDVASWNENKGGITRGLAWGPIDPDPDGSLLRIKRALDKLIEANPE